MADHNHLTAIQRQVTRWCLVMTLIIFYTVVMTPRSLVGSKLPLSIRQGYKPVYRVFYQRGNSEEDLPECSHFEVCNKVDTYSTPWIERQCRCAGKQSCPLSSEVDDGHSVLDKSRQFKLCEPVSKLPTCRYFRDVTWTHVSHPDNTTQQIMHCVCPKNSVAYILKHQAYYTPAGVGYRYAFVCSPQSWQRCQRKEPCRLFTVKKRPGVEDVNTNRLCECPLGFTCPEKYNEPSVMVDTIGFQDQTRTYSGYCAPAVD
ncbi:protein giant-lens-like [Limulus polyphemus]|uniref:Protein giant-lens-like n=1 Tax=Limulus polyphemus TaxID=6850 RepID=A0ABM1SNC7_LIMPO|nr:protein giant-lens-like [Limulus polyphemus]